LAAQRRTIVTPLGRAPPGTRQPRQKAGPQGLVMSAEQDQGVLK